MRISKAQHLKTLLLVLDISVGAGVYMVIIDLLLWQGSFNYIDWTAHVSLLPLVILSDAVTLYRMGGSLTGSGQSFGLARSKGLALLALLGIVFLLKLDFVSRLVVLGYAIGSVTAAIVIRSFLRWWYYRGRQELAENYQKVLIIGSGARAVKLTKTITEHSDWGLEVVGYVDPDPARTGCELMGKRVLGQPMNIGQILSGSVIDEVIVALPRKLLSDVQPVIAACEEQGVCLRFMADLYDMDVRKISLELAGEIPIVSMESVIQDGGKLVVKRLFDLFAVMIALPAIAPLLVLIAIAVKFESRGPVFFSQDRVGLNKRRFKMLKFRSMYADAEHRLHEIEHLNEASGPIFKMTDDPRVTRIGRFIRRTSLDEIPQLINVFFGQMSLVGPRAMSERDVALFDRGVQRKRFSVKPGITCLREISGRSELSFEQWLELDLRYIDQWSLLLDLSILLRTIPVVLRGEGAV